MPHETLLHREQTVLVIVDMQEKLLPAVESSDAILRNARILIEGAKILGIPILVTEQYPQGLGPTVAALSDVLGDAPRYPKLSFSCLGDDAFLAALESLDRDQILICGVETHICVLQTALDVLEHGWMAAVAAEAVSSRNGAYCHLGIERMRRAGVVVTCAESALFEMMAVAGTDEFRAISRLVK